MLECFVIMGFGTKHDPDTGRTLNLDSTYEFIIKPAVEASGHTCVRADEILHSGVIDRPMYEKLLTADLVVADITTANANAIYELGVRHALRPRSTIVIKEQDGKRYFDLNHLATISYKHLGEEIGAGEAKRKVAELRALIEAKERAPKDDSPVYQFLHELTPPTLASPGGRRGLAGSTEMAKEASRAELYRLVDSSLAAEDFAAARDVLEDLLERGFDDPSTIQKLALATYKSEEPDAITALGKAYTIIERLGPSFSTDPETLGIAAAIRKRQWLMAGDAAALDDAIALYCRDWAVRENYYARENYASCLEMRADVAADQEQVAIDRVTALGVRRRLFELLAPLVARPAAKKRGDYKWMLATLSNTQRALGDSAGAAKSEKALLAASPAGWEIEAFEATKKDAAGQAAKYGELRKRMGL